MFYDFFEKFMKDKGYSDIVFYAHHPAAVAICRKHRYRDGGYLKGLNEYVFYLSLKCNGKVLSRALSRLEILQVSEEPLFIGD